MKKSLIYVFALLLIFACVGKQVKTTEAPGLTYTYESPIDPIDLWTWNQMTAPIPVLHPTMGEGIMIQFENPDTFSEWEHGGIFITAADLQKPYAEGQYPFISAFHVNNSDGLRFEFMIMIRARTDMCLTKSSA